MSTVTYPNGDASTDTVTNLLGWGNYADGLATPTQTFTSVDSLLTIDALGGGTNETYLPNSLAGGTSLWDGTTNKITPVAVGDSYDLRVVLQVTAKATSPTRLTLELDIGGQATPTNIIAEQTVSAEKTTPFISTFSFPIFCLNTFLANGGQLFVRTDTGSVTVASRSILLSRNYSANS